MQLNNYVKSILPEMNRQTVLSVLVWASMMFFMIWAMIHYAYWIVNPYPNEFREGVALDITHLMRQGINPFSSGVPGSFFYMYGFLNAWVATAGSFIIGSNNYILQRVISVVCAIISGLVIAREVRKRSSSPMYTTLAFLLMLITSWVIIEVNARPDQLGLLLNLLALIGINRIRRAWGLIIPSVLTIAAFYTKQYFLIAGAEIFIFLLLVNKTYAVIYGILTGTLLVGSVLLVNWLYPTYLSMTVLSFGGTESSISHLAIQIRAFGAFYWPLLIGVTFAFVSLFRHTRISFNLHQWNKPLIVLTNRISKVASRSHTGGWTIYHVTFIVASLTLLLIGSNKGAIFSYFYQLLLPSVIVIGLPAIKEDCPAKWSQPLLVMLCVCSLIHYNFKHNFTPFLTRAETLSWKTAHAIIDNNKGNKVCLETPIFVDKAIKNKITYYNNGHTDGPVWLGSSWERLMGKNPRAGQCFFSAAPSIIERYNKYYNERITGIENGMFDLVVTAKHIELRGDTSLEKNYALYKTLTLRTGYQSSDYEFWLRRR
jgi:hypothetical protein